MVRVVVSGICGKMGRRIALLASKDKDLEIAGGLEAPGNPSIGKDIGEILEKGKIGKKIESDFKKIASACDSLIEFTSSEATMKHIKIACDKKVSMVIGTTAFSSQQLEEIKEASKKIPIVFSPNMSVGANVLFKLAEQASLALGEVYEASITEAHHKHKKDAPSGTAKRLGEAVSKVRGKMPEIKSIREGEIVGDHSVIFKGKSETIELTHRARSRDVFAEGALAAAKFLASKGPGLYNMYDVINQTGEGHGV